MRKTLITAALACGLAAPLFAPSAVAEMVRRDEAGAATFVLAAPVAPGSEAVDVMPGAVAWTEAVRPQSAVRLMADAPARNGPGRTNGPARGAILFGYVMESGGEAFCPIGPSQAQGRARVQCYRDFDADGDFDGAYVSLIQGQDYLIKVGRLTRLTPVRQLAFEVVSDAAAIPPIEAALRFDGWRGGEARFTLSANNETLGDYSCAPDADGVCAMLGLSLRVEAMDGGGARISVLAAEDERQLRLDFT